MHIFILPQWKQHLWKSKECFWKSRSCPIRSPRSFKQLSEIFLHVFAHWTGFYALSAREKFEGRNEAGSDQIGSIARDRILLLLLLLREREREKKDRNMDATYFAKRTKLVSTSEVDIEERDAVVRYMRAKFIEHVYTSAYGVSSLRERESLPRLNFHRKFSNTLIIGSLLSLYLIRNAIFVRIFGVISFPSLVCPPSFQQKLSTFAVSKKGAIKCFIVSRLILFDNFFL